MGGHGRRRGRRLRSGGRRFRHRLAIIGGGYTGLSCAYHLARDYSVTAHVLEANRVGWGCSGRNGGFCSIALGKEDFGDWIARFGLERAKANFEVGRDAVRTVHDIITDEQIDCDRPPEGGLELAHRPSRLPEMEARAKRMNELFGLDSRVLSKSRSRRRLLDKPRGARRRAAQRRLCPSRAVVCARNGECRIVEGRPHP